MNPKRKLLIFIDWFYPGFRAGGPVASCLNLVNELYTEYDIFIFTRANDYNTNINYETIIANQWIDFQSIAKIYYLDQNDLSYKKIKQIINEVNPDVVYLNSMFSYYFSILPIFINHFFLKKINPKVVLVPRGMLMRGNLQFNLFKKLTFLKVFRTLQLQQKITLQVTSLEEKVEALKYLNLKERQAHLVTNIPSKNLLSDFKPAEKKSKQLKIYFSSRIAREKNILYALEVIQTLDFPIQLDIFGAVHHQAYWETCLEVIDKLPSYIQVDYKNEYEPTTIKSIFKEYHAFIFPTFGENFGHVLMEAFSLGKPVITTPNVPWTDIEAKQAGWIIDLESKKRYQEVLKLLFEMSQEEYIIYATGAHNYATEFLNKTNYKLLYRNLFDS